MDYSLHQRGRARIDFLSDLRRLSDRFEALADNCPEARALQSAELPDDPAELQQRIAPVMESLPDFRLLRLCRDWTLEAHGHIAMDAFEEIRPQLEEQLDELRHGTASLRCSKSLQPPDYWDGVEFHKSAGGWDGHDYMGFIHGELIHRKMVNPNFAGMIYRTRKSVAQQAPLKNPMRILEIGCCSGQYTQGLAEVFPAAEIHACDLSMRQLEQAQRYANEQGLRWQLFQADGADTGCADDSFDLVTSYAVFHELPVSAARAVLRECLRVTRPGGFTVIGDVKSYTAFEPYARWKNDYWNQVHGGDPYWREYAMTDFAALARKAGFSTAEWHGLGEQQYPFVLVASKAAAQSTDTDQQTAETTV